MYDSFFLIICKINGILVLEYVGENMYRRKKNQMLIVLLLVLVVMTSALAAFRTNLLVNGTATVSNSWNVHITDISLKSTSQANPNPYGNADSPSTMPGGGTNPTYTDTTATFYSTLGVPGDSITYVVTIENSGTVNAIVDSIQWIKSDGTVDNQYNVSPIIYTYSFPGRNQVLAKNGGTTTLEVTVTYDNSVTDQPASELLEKSATLSIKYVQTT